MHRLLQRQLRKCFGRSEGLASEVEQLISLVSDAYAQSDEDREQIERSMDLSSKELLERNRELGLAESKYRAIFENVCEGIFQVTPSGELLSANPSLAKICGYENSDALKSAIVNMGDQVYARPGRRAEVLERIEREGSAIELESEWRRRDGTIIWISETAHAVRDANGNVSYYEGTIWDITGRKSAEAERQQLHARLVALSRQAGMAEVATGVLHNVGNVLNSVNVSADVIATRLRESELASLTKVIAILREHSSDLTDYLTSHPQGQMVPQFLGELVQCLNEEQSAIQAEVTALARGIEHIKQIVSAQQSIAKGSNLLTAADPAALMDAALVMHGHSMERHSIEVVRRYESVGEIPLDKHKVLQILINLVSNAKHAISAHGGGVKRITATIRRTDASPKQLKFELADTGNGIRAENLTRIFSHGFTTKADGHGFGLHSAANAAREMGGSLSAVSAGDGMGATFILELPLHSVELEKP